MKTLILAAAALAASACSPTPPATMAPAAMHGNPAPVQGQVTKVVDGDTVHVLANGKNLDVRILGIDTPEVVDPRKPVQCGGPEASQFAHQHLDGKTVTLTGDSTQQDTDRYHRVLRYVQLPDGTDYSVAVTAAGWARAYVYAHKPVAEYAAIEAAQAHAQQGRHGLWGLCPNPAPGD